MGSEVILNGIATVTKGIFHECFLLSYGIIFDLRTETSCFLYFKIQQCQSSQHLVFY